ncbi:MAG: polyhydroxyalkanoic acid system family protein [Hyphomicrobiales bacterium]|nr:polyhydroxyalkanoic acid system family protein [Hyphomicrobiales bacterium]
MPKMSMSVPHSLGQAEALRRVQTIAGQLKTQHGDQISDLREQWQGNVGDFSFKAMGFNVAGRLTVSEHEVSMAGDLPLMAVPFKSQIERLIRDEAAKALA